MTEDPFVPPQHLAGMLIAAVPHAADVGMIVVELGKTSAVLKLAYGDKLIGDPETGVVHGGVITSLLDNACGVAVGTTTQIAGGIATLDMRIDYMKPATPGEAIHAFADCYRMTKSIAFVRGVAYHTDRDDPIAAVSAAFMLASSAGKVPGVNLKGTP